MRYFNRLFNCVGPFHQLKSWYLISFALYFPVYWFLAGFEVVCSFFIGSQDTFAPKIESPLILALLQAVCELTVGKRTLSAWQQQGSPTHAFPNWLESLNHVQPKPTHVGALTVVAQLVKTCFLTLHETMNPLPRLDSKLEAPRISGTTFKNAIAYGDRMLVPCLDKIITWLNVETEKSQSPGGIPRILAETLAELARLDKTVARATRILLDEKVDFNFDQLSNLVTLDKVILQLHRGDQKRTNNFKQGEVLS
jgi:hypothetical protein